jgi:hypothetical protein
VKLLYKPFGVLVGGIAAVVAQMLWKRLWRVLGPEARPPRATDRDLSWPQVVGVSAMRGVVFGVVRAVMKRSAATAFADFTGTWPGRQTAERTTRER